jgi:uridine kinase
MDIQHTPYPPSTEFLPVAEVRAFGPGLVLQFATEEKTSYGSGQRLLNTYLEARDWNRMIGVSTVGELNAKALQESTAGIVRKSEALQEKKIIQLADQINERNEIRLVCLSGPSSSGKSTVAQRLATQLEVNGLNPVLLSLDDYYRDRRDIPEEGTGQKNYEAPHALDLDLFALHLSKLLAGESVPVPRFDFVNGRRLAPQTLTSLPDGDKGLLLIEGLHALNPLVWKQLPEKNVFRIFVSALTQLVFDENNRIQTSKVRLLRRIVRDRRFRGTPTEETLSRWNSVREGEKAYIFPFQEDSDAIFNSSLVYEAAVLKVFAQRYLLEVPRNDPGQGEAYQLLKFLDLFVPVFPDRVPSNSILREFIGGGGYSY